MLAIDKKGVRIGETRLQLIVRVNFEPRLGRDEKASHEYLEGKKQFRLRQR